MGNRERNGTLTDGEILKLYFRRDEFAVAETDRKYGSYLLRTAERFLTDRRDREERSALRTPIWGRGTPFLPKSPAP